ncbi:MAG: HAD family hydrolase [Flavobacteriales bacterium]|nr:HAD family hydrolase [Flavobacteriales bacterium]NNK81313.1 HAD family hydrolase [Flavobacteriales bacterium]
MNKAVFLDRDGVINRDPGDYTKNWREFEFNDDVIDVLKEFQDAGFKLIIITNQGGIAKGLYSQEDYDHLTKNMLEVMSRNNLEISEVYFSPHHDDYSRSISRKPDSLLFERALYKYDIDPLQSFIIGDKERDIFAGEKVGVKGVLIPVNGSLQEVKNRILKS